MPKLAVPSPSSLKRALTVWPAGQVTVPAARSMAKSPLEKKPFSCAAGGRRGDPRHDLEALALEVLEGRAVRVRAVGEDLGFVVHSRDRLQQVVDGFAVGDVGRRLSYSVDQLRAGVD